MGENSGAVQEGNSEKSNREYSLKHCPDIHKTLYSGRETQVSPGEPFIARVKPMRCFVAFSVLNSQPERLEPGGSESGLFLFALVTRRA